MGANGSLSYGGFPLRNSQPTRDPALFEVFPFATHERVTLSEKGEGRVEIEAGGATSIGGDMRCRAEPAQEPEPTSAQGSKTDKIYIYL